MSIGTILLIILIIALLGSFSGWGGGPFYGTGYYGGGGIGLVLLIVLLLVVTGRLDQLSKKVIDAVGRLGRIDLAFIAGPSWGRRRHSDCPSLAVWDRPGMPIGKPALLAYFVATATLIDKPPRTPTPRSGLKPSLQRPVRGGPVIRKENLATAA